MTSPVLLITRDELLLDDLLRLAAAAGTTLDVAHDSTAALRAWGSASVVLLGADQVDVLAAHRPPRREGVHVVSHGPVADGLFRSALASGAADVVELPQADAWLVEVLTDAADGGIRRASTVGVVAGSGGVGATTFACALGLCAAADGPTVLVDLDPLGPGVDRVVGLDAVADDVERAHAGTCWWGRTAGSGPVRSATRCRRRTAWRCSPGPRDRRCRSTLRRSARCSRPRSAATSWWSSTCPVGSTTWAPRSCRGATGCWWWSSRRSPVSRPRARSWRRCARSTRRWPWWSGRPGRPSPPTTSPTSWSCPSLAEVPTQRRLAEHLDLGLGPVHGRRSPLARAARATLQALAAPTSTRSVA